MVKRLEEEDRDILPRLAQHVRQDDALRLETRGEARRVRVRQRGGNHGARITHVSISSRALRIASAASSSDAARRARSANRSAALTGAKAIRAPCSRAAFTIIPAPAV